MQFLLQSLIFENLVEGYSKEGLILMQYHIQKYLDQFRSDQLTLNSKSPQKMMYDSVRIFGLRIAVQLNEKLIGLHANPQDAELKKKVIQKLICLCQNTMLLKQNDKHL